jgi:ArsR family transcriptional regulator
VAQPSAPLVALSRLYKALGDDTRLRIVALLSHGELCVCHVEAALGLPQPTTSRHLAVLRNAGVVETRRDGSWIYYRLASDLEPQAQRQLGILARQFAGKAELRREVQRAVKSCGPGACK